MARRAAAARTVAPPPDGVKVVYRPEIQNLPLYAARRRKMSRAWSVVSQRRLRAFIRIRIFSGLAGFSGFHFAHLALFAITGNPAKTNMDYAGIP